MDRLKALVYDDNDDDNEEGSECPFANGKS
jgi:hypothetical protein